MGVLKGLLALVLGVIVVGIGLLAGPLIAAVLSVLGLIGGIGVILVIVIFVIYEILHSPPPPSE